MEEVGGEDGEFEREREGVWEGVDFVPRKVLPEAMLAERSLVDEHFFPNTLRLLGAFIIIFMGAIIIIMFMSPPF